MGSPGPFLQGWGTWASLGWGWATGLLSPQTLVGSCIHSANQLAREVRGCFPAGDPICFPWALGRDTPAFLGWGGAADILASAG